MPARAGDDVAVYVGDPGALGVHEPVEWPAGVDFATRVRWYVTDSAVRVRRVDS